MKLRKETLKRIEKNVYFYRWFRNYFRFLVSITNFALFVEAEKQKSAHRIRTIRRYWKMSTNLLVFTFSCIASCIQYCFSKIKIWKISECNEKKKSLNCNNYFFTPFGQQRWRLCMGMDMLFFLLHCIAFGENLFPFDFMYHRSFCDIHPSFSPFSLARLSLLLSHAHALQPCGNSDLPIRQRPKKKKKKKQQQQRQN